MTTENKTVVDLMRAYVRVSDMCDEYNKEHSTDINPWECVLSDDREFDHHPKFIEGFADYKFAIAILEGRPVFPPAKKRTFMLNGVELPCPVKNETDHCFQFGDSQFFYETEAECWKITLCLENQFAAARDKE